MGTLDLRKLYSHWECCVGSRQTDVFKSVPSKTRSPKRDRRGWDFLLLCLTGSASERRREKSVVSTQS